MSKSFRWLSVTFLGALLTVGVASAETQIVLKANVPFAFSAAGSQLPAGNYRIEQDMQPEAGTLLVRNLDTGKAVHVEFMTRLAQRPGDQGTLVFDKVGDQHLLAEIHLPDADGFYIPGAKVAHTHVSVKAMKKG